MEFRREATVKSLIRQPDHRFGTVLPANWVAASRFHLSVAALLGFAAVVLARRVGRFSDFLPSRWSSEDSDGSEKLPAVPGLQNFGNNCFLNVILQALASCVSFQPFLQKIIEDSEHLAVEEPVENVPLSVTLSALLKELCLVDQKRVTLSPWKVMVAMTNYIPSFNLTNQQDAAEAFLHLLSSLREEFYDCYHSGGCSLGDISSSSHRIHSPKEKEDCSQLERWQRDGLGPLEGILGSTLTCQSCSSQISLSFESFQILPLSPALDGGATNIEDCLKQFSTAELVENYHCSMCWHDAGVKYLTSIEAPEMEIKIVRMCYNHDSCNCRSLIHLQKLPWSNKFSRTWKQLSIARSPKILCLHLKRATVNIFGETIKLKGHISFPFILDLFPFIATGVEIRDLDKNLQRGPVRQGHANQSLDSNFYRMERQREKLNNNHGSMGGNFAAQDVPIESKFEGQVESVPGESCLSSSEDCTDTFFLTDAPMTLDDKVDITSMTCLYRLVSVVEHFGRAGSGHYTVYRSVQHHHQQQWFAISDSEVHRVTKEDVLEAEATLLFYEKILES